MRFSLTSTKGRNSRRQSPMTEVHQYWTNQKDPGAAAAAVVAVVVVVVLEGADPPAWEDCSRLECRS